jgi:pimeloyl-ACP methyl ester carboxylesterase
MPSQRILSLILSIVSTSVLAVSLFVALSLFGRGTRPAIGTRMDAWTDLRRVEYYDSSSGRDSGETVVLLASLARSVSDFNELASALGDAGYRTIAIESHGIGGTDGGGPFEASSLHDLARDVDSVLQASAPHRGGRVHVIGHAFGNRVARTFATDYPERVQSLGLIAAGGRESIPQEIEQALVRSTLSFLPDAIQEPALRLAFFADGNPIPDHWRNGWWFWGGMAQRVAAQSTDSADFWSGGSAPMLVVQAEDDMIAPPQQAGLPLKFEYPDRVSLVGVPQAGHALLPEQPERIADALLSFLAAHPIVR